MKNFKRQNGFLSILAILLVVVVSFIVSAAAFQFTTDSRTSSNQLASAQAFYLARSGIEAANHYITDNQNSCTSINGAANFTNASFTGANGVFTVIGTQTTASTTLNGNITAAVKTITLASTTGFAASGVILIDSESINYRSISGKRLIGATRGAAGTTAATHTTGTAVSQYQCALTSTGFSPNLTSPVGKRILKEILQGSGFSLGKSGSGGALTPALVTLGSASISGPASIINGSVTATNPSFEGSTVISRSNIVFNNSGNTQIGNGSGGLRASSTSGTLQPDAQAHYDSFNAGNLFGLYFNNQTKTAVQASANQSYKTVSSLNGVTGKTIWFNNYFNPSSGTTIGSDASPVILIVDNNANIASGVTIYGFLYVIQGLSMNGGSIIGGAATENALNINGGNASITFNPGIMTKLNTMNTNFGSPKYLSTPASLQEIIP